MGVQLAAEQALVVYAEPGDLFVAAGAGSGKTRVLVSRFVAAVLGEAPYQEHDTDDILAITFTEKAAGELAARVRIALLEAGRGVEARRVQDAWISTIHGMCSRILRRHAFNVGIDPRFGVCTDLQAMALADEAFERAARELMQDSTVERLIVDLGASLISRVVQTAHGQLSSMGRALDDVEIAGPPDARIFEDIRREIVQMTQELEEMPASPSVVRSIALGRELETLLGSAFVGASTEAAARFVLATLGTRHFDRRCGAAAKPTTEVGNECLERLVQELTRAVNAPYEAAFSVLLLRFGKLFGEAKDALGLLDFEDLQLKTAQLFEEHPEIAARYRSAFKLVMIDEFQDTNALQLRIARALSDDDLLTVGDDKQSIYRFRHADVEVFKRLGSEAASVRVLKANYRSHAEVLGTVNEIFDSSVFFKDDFIRLAAGRDVNTQWPWPEGEPRTRLLLVDKRDLRGNDVKNAEARALAHHLASLREQGVPQAGMAILLRAMTNRAERFERALRAEGFDVYVASGGTFFDRPEVDDVAALLKVIDNPRDDQALLQCLAGRLVGLSDDSLYSLVNSGPGRLWDRVTSGTAACTNEVDAALLGRAMAVFEHLRDMRGREGISRLIHEACEALDYDLALFASGPDGPRAWANVLKLARLAEEFERGPHGGLGAFLEHIAMRRDRSADSQAPLASEGVDAVRIMSVHAAKGLEFPVVVVADLGAAPRRTTDDVLVGRGDSRQLAIRLPKAASPDGVTHESPLYAALKTAELDAEDEESKRVLYVACTRAREALILCGSGDPTAEAKGETALDRMRRAIGAGGPIPGLEGEVLLPGGSSVAVTVVRGSVPVAKLCTAARDDTFDADAFLETPRPVPGTPTRPAAVSYTALALFGRCPYKFYALRIAGLRTPALEKRGAGPLGFGTAVHAVLELSGDAMPSPGRLAAIAVANGLEAPERERLERAVRAFLASPVAADIATSERVVRECSFATPLGETLLSGNLDLLCWHGSNATVVDYKTGSVGLDARAAEERYRPQAECYALAVLRAGAQRVSVRFIEVERECRETRFDFEPTDGARVEAGMLGTLGKMEAGEFPHLAAYDCEVCADCPALGGLCPINPPEDVSGEADRTRR